MFLSRMAMKPKGASACMLSLKGEVAMYQLVGGVVAYQGDDA